jgi:RNA polymerase sigma factor (sigma-70 family)
VVCVVDVALSSASKQGCGRRPRSGLVKNAGNRQAARCVYGVVTTDLAELFELRREPMARLAYVLIGNAQIADEIVQDAFLRMHANWSTIDNPSAYLRTTVINGCRSHHRRVAVERRRPAERQEPSALGANELSDAIGALSYDHQVVLSLRYFCDLSDNEIADVLHIRPGTVRVRLHRALNRLRKELSR